MDQIFIFQNVWKYLPKSIANGVLSFQAKISIFIFGHAYEKN